MPTTFGELRDQLEEALRAGRLLRSVVAKTGGVRARFLTAKISRFRPDFRHHDAMWRGPKSNRRC